jgi:hypothetical protein
MTSAPLPESCPPSALLGEERLRLAEQRITELEQQVADLAANFERLRKEALMFKAINEAAWEHPSYPSALKADRRRARIGSRHLRPVGGDR